MTTNAGIRAYSRPVADPERGHHLRLAAAWALAVAVVIAIAAYGLDYYTLSTMERPFSPKHALLRPSGSIGIKLGMLGVGMFMIIYLYYFRKSWKWLNADRQDQPLARFSHRARRHRADHHRLPRRLQIPRASPAWPSGSWLPWLSAASWAVICTRRFRGA